MTRLIVIAAALLALAVTPLSCRTEGIKVGSKKFTEGVILGGADQRLGGRSGGAGHSLP